MKGITVLWFDVFYITFGIVFFVATVTIAVAVFWNACRDPETERIAQARGDYQIGGGNHV